MWSARQKVRQETRNNQGEYAPYDAAPSNATLSFEEGRLDSDEDFARLAEDYGVEVTGNDGESVEVNGRAQDIRALAYEVEERHGAKPDITVVASEDSTPAWSQSLEDYADSEEVTARVTPGDPSEDAPSDQPVKYSFLADFEAREEQFNADFDGVPNRFFTANLRGDVPTRLGRPMWQPGSKEAAHAHVSPDLDLHEFVDRMDNDDDANTHLAYFHHRDFAKRLCNSASEPSENKISDEEAQQLLESMPGAVAVERGSDRLTRMLRGKATRSWAVTLRDEDGKTGRMVVSDGGTTELQHSSVNGISPEPLDHYEHFTRADLRMVAGSERIRRKTGHNLLVPLTTDRGKRWSDPESAEQKLTVLSALRDTEDAQDEGQKFLSQRQYLRNQGGRIATAFDDKKNPDKTRQQMMDQTSLTSSNGGPFTKVEIDNDVDPESFDDFERAYREVAEKLPSVPGDRAPELRIRKLGKHRTNGVYSAGRNAVAVDVHTSEAFVHEMGHYYDLTVQNNASLSSDFADISKQYRRSLKVNDARDREYYNTPTEQLTRGFEVYAVERLGINNRLVTPEKFDRPDYAPYTADEDLKEQTFSFFDRLFQRS